jgi:hypothetical protein
MQPPATVCSDGETLRVHLRGVEMAAQAPTPKLFRGWGATACPREAFELVQDFVADVLIAALKGPGGSQHARQGTKRADEAPESAGAAKRAKTERLYISD